MLPNHFSPPSRGKILRFIAGRNTCGYGLGHGNPLLDREFAGDILLFAIPSDEAAQMVDRGACNNKLVARGLTD